MYDQLTATLNANMEALFVAMTTIRELDLQNVFMAAMSEN
jgi:hypothetical protein